MSAERHQIMPQPRHASRLHRILKFAILFSVAVHLFRFDELRPSLGARDLSEAVDGGPTISATSSPFVFEKFAVHNDSAMSNNGQNQVSRSNSNPLHLHEKTTPPICTNSHNDYCTGSVPRFDKKKISQEQQWNNESLWTTVSPNKYEDAVRKTREALDPLVDQVYTSCYVIVTPATLEEMPSERQSLISFWCNGTMQDRPCHGAANLCLVVPLRDVDNLRSIKFGENKTALLMMVDSMDYLLFKNEFAWKSFLNKAAYAYQSKRPLFIWIGRLDDEGHVLHSRENEAVYHAFGAACDPDFRPEQNSLHYYKGIAIASMFHKQSLVPSLSTAFFLDADISFTNDAFLRMHRSFKDDRHNMNSFGPEDYFEISPQASLWGSQNTRGQIVMNGGLLGLRNNSWTHDFCALWWFTRCGHKDQRGM